AILDVGKRTELARPGAERPCRMTRAKGLIDAAVLVGIAVVARREEQGIAEVQVAAFAAGRDILDRGGTAADGLVVLAQGERRRAALERAGTLLDQVRKGQDIAVAFEVPEHGLARPGAHWENHDGNGPLASAAAR